MDRVGDNEVLIRGKTNHEDYKLGKPTPFAETHFGITAKTYYLIMQEPEVVT